MKKPRYALRHPNHCTHQEYVRHPLSKCGKYVAIPLDPINPYEYGSLWTNEHIIVYCLGRTEESLFYGVALNNIANFQGKASWWHKAEFRPIKDRHIRVVSNNTKPFYHERPMKLFRKLTGWLIRGGYVDRKQKEIPISWYSVKDFKFIIV